MGVTMIQTGVHANSMVTRSAMGSNSVVSARCERPPAFARAGK